MRDTFDIKKNIILVILVIAIIVISIIYIINYLLDKNIDNESSKISMQIENDVIY